MKRFCLSFLFVIFALPALALADDLVRFDVAGVEVRLERGVSGHELLIHRSEESGGRMINAFAIEDPSRLVIDIPTSIQEHPAKFEVKDALVTSIRTGPHPDKVRIVVDLKVDGELIFDSFTSSDGLMTKIVFSGEVKSAADAEIPKELMEPTPVTEPGAIAEIPVELLEQEQPAAPSVAAIPVEPEPVEIEAEPTKIAPDWRPKQEPVELAEEEQTQEFEPEPEAASDPTPKKVPIIVGFQDPDVPADEPRELEEVEIDIPEPTRPPADDDFWPAEEAPFVEEVSPSQVMDFDELQAIVAANAKPKEPIIPIDEQGAVDEDAYRNVLKEQYDKLASLKPKGISPIILAAAFLSVVTLLLIIMIGRASAKKRSIHSGLGSIHQRVRSNGRLQAAAGVNRVAERDSYKLLGVEESFTDEQIRQQYRRLMKAFHTDALASKDLAPEMLEMAEERLRKVQEAFEIVARSRGMS